MTERWIEVQKTAFTRWSNTYLAHRNLSINDIGTDLHDGILLNNLLEVISGRKLQKWNRRPQLRIQRLANLNIGLSFLKQEGIQLVNIGAEDIEQGNLKIILGLIWILILRYQILKFESLENTGDDSASKNKPTAESAKDSLLRWVNEQTATYQQANGIQKAMDFTKSFQDGRLLYALTDSLDPGVLDMAGMREPIPTCTAAMTTAFEEFGIVNLMDPTDVVNTPQEHSMMAYISFFQQWQRTGMQRKRKEVNVAGYEGNSNSIPTDNIIAPEPPVAHVAVVASSEEGPGFEDTHREDVFSKRQEEDREELLRVQQILRAGEKEEEDDMRQTLSVASPLGYLLAPPDLTKQKFQLILGCSGVPKVVLVGRSSPMVGLFVMMDGVYKLVDYTEWFVGEHDPVFVKPIVLYYDPERDGDVNYRAVVWHVSKPEDGKVPVVTDKDMIGYADLSLRNVISVSDDALKANGGVVRFPMKNPNSKIQAKIQRKNSTVNICLRSTGLRVGHVVGMKEIKDHAGEKIDMRVSLFGYKFAQRQVCPMIGILQKVSQKKYELISTTEWQKRPSEATVLFGKHIHCYAQTKEVRPRNNYDKWMRVCLFNVPEPEQTMLRAQGRTVVQVGDNLIIGYRDISVSDILNTLEFGLALPFFAVGDLKDVGSFRLKAFICPEITHVRVVEVFQREIPDLVGHEVDMRIQGANLFKMDMASPADPVCVLFERDERTGRFAYIGQTEWRKTDLSPTFETPIRFHHDFLRDRVFRINVYDVDLEDWERKKQGNSRHVCPIVRADDQDLMAEPTLLGCAMFSLHQLLSGSSVPVRLELPPSGHARPDDAWRRKRISDRAPSVSMSIKVHNAVPQKQDFMKRRALERPADPSCEITVQNCTRRRADPTGHELFLYVNAENLIKRDWSSLSDPMVCLFERVKRVVAKNAGGWVCPSCTFVNPVKYLVCEVCSAQKPADAREQPTQQQGQGADNNAVEYEWQLLDQTEWQVDATNPVFKRHFSLFFDPESNADKELKFVVYDVDTEQVGDEDIIGLCTASLSTIVTHAEGEGLTFTLTHPDPVLNKLLMEKHASLSVRSVLETVIPSAGNEVTPDHKQREKRRRIKEGQVPSCEHVCLKDLRPTFTPQYLGSAPGLLRIKVGFKHLLKMNWFNRSNPGLLLFQLDNKSKGPSNASTLIGATSFFKACQEGLFFEELIVPIIPSDGEKQYRFKIFNVADLVLGEEMTMGWCDVSEAQLYAVAVKKDGGSSGGTLKGYSQFPSGVGNDLGTLPGVEGGGTGGVISARRSSIHEQVKATKWAVRLQLSNDSPDLRSALARKKSSLYLSVSLITSATGGTLSSFFPSR